MFLCFKLGWSCVFTLDGETLCSSTLGKWGAHMQELWVIHQLVSLPLNTAEKGSSVPLEALFATFDDSKSLGGVISVYLKRRTNLNPSPLGAPRETDLTVSLWVKAYCSLLWGIFGVLTNSVNRHLLQEWSEFSTMGTHASLGGGNLHG